VPESKQPTSEQDQNRSGGGIVFGGGTRSQPRDTSDPGELVRGFRRRWASGVAIVTVADADLGLRGITATSLMVASLEPPAVAISIADGTFRTLVGKGTVLGVSILESAHEFPAERFAGRAPLPDARFTGVQHTMEDGVPVISGALAWCSGRVTTAVESGDHLVVFVELERGAIPADTDDPLLSYEGRYRRLEAS
jgi:3-hydroxy-9,10-secoandrosta-1,3,5(10)-triene-9,17-dione monooxygenase reductase component